MKSGVCSITFRDMKPADLVGITKEAGLDAIEWGSDVHVPVGRMDIASEVSDMTKDAGLEVSSYGSYYQVIGMDGKPQDFAPVLDTAFALNTRVIRIWAGTNSSDICSLSDRSLLIKKLQDDLALADQAGVKIALEFHANTLSDSNEATLGLLKEIDLPNLLTYWQPVYWLSDSAYRLEGLQKMASKVLNLHVFHWLFQPVVGSWGASTDRRPLIEGEHEWNKYLKVELDSNLEHFALMEFVRRDNPDQFLQDAQVLKQWLKNENYALNGVTS